MTEEKKRVAWAVVYTLMIMLCVGIVSSFIYYEKGITEGKELERGLNLLPTEDGVVYRVVVVGTPVNSEKGGYYNLDLRHHNFFGNSFLSFQDDLQVCESKQVVFEGTIIKEVE